eukprot:TRINITY_DN69681_c0_g1_i1.p1 TRINITY_DN69681_c0_g1~~TRINITY_DN69681_c0_g1_i1.p1  ORF type:complete len:443 (-),score=97.21 TRINITY_DN69681_c0_g1_i1:37-1326(-)
MGCSGSKTGAAPREMILPATVRRRLSLGDTDAESAQDAGEEAEADRSLLLQLSEQDLHQLVSESKGFHRSFSIGSQTDANLGRRKSFQAKDVQTQGGTFNPKEEAIGYACRKGLKPESPNQDSFMVLKVAGEERQFSLFGVFDGHGKKGHDVSNFIKEHLPKVLLRNGTLWDDPLTALTDAFGTIQLLIEKAAQLGELDAKRSGSTCSVVLFDHKGSTLYVGHVGDSRVVLGKSEPSISPGESDAADWQSLDLTVDHKPDLPEERQRIEAAGGMVVFDGGWNYRVYARGKVDERGKRYPGLNMSRAMGDLNGFHHAGISANPDVKLRFVGGEAVDGKGDPKRQSSLGSVSEPSVRSLSITSRDRFVLLCSDGVWEFISSEEAVRIVAQFTAEQAMEAADHLASLAWQRWMAELEGQVVDDITAVVFHLN